MLKLRPLSDWIVLKRHEYAHPTLYVHGQATHRGTVVAVGPGKPIKRFVEVVNPATGKLFKTRAGAEFGKRKPIDVIPGDVVEYSDYGWEEHEFGGEKYVFTRQDSIIGISSSTDPEGIQGHSSPSYD